MDRKIISALNKLFKERLGQVLPEFTQCPDETIDKKAYTNGMKAYCAPFKNRFGYIKTIPYMKFYNGFSVSVYWASAADAITYCLPMKSFKFELFWEKNHSIPEEFSDCGVGLHTLAKENGFFVRDSNITTIDISREDIADKGKLINAINVALDDVLADIEKYALPLLNS